MKLYEKLQFLQYYKGIIMTIFPEWENRDTDIITRYEGYTYGIHRLGSMKILLKMGPGVLDYQVIETNLTQDRICFIKENLPQVLMEDLL